MGEEPTDTWARALRDLSAEQFGKGLVACRDSRDSWPPTLPQFRSWCVGSDGTTAMERAAHRPFERDRALEDHGARERAKESGEIEMRNIRAMLGI